MNVGEAPSASSAAAAAGLGRTYGPPPNPHAGTLDVWEGGYPQSVDPQTDYDTDGLGVVQNVYETLVTYSGNSTVLFVPELATCVPGTSQCVTDYGTSLLVNGTGALAHEPVYWTFVIDPAARFYDPQTGASWGVYPSDVMFSVARDVLWANPPGNTPGWILGQALLPTGNPSWDGGLHAPYNSTPADVLGSMLVNNSTFCPVAALTDAHGCLTFVADGGGLSWGSFLEFLADPLGASVDPCGWFTYESAGIPNWTGPSGPHGDAPCRLPNGGTSTDGSGWATYLQGLSPTGWDPLERLISTQPKPQPNVASQMVGSGPYYASSVNLTLGYLLRANPAYATSTGCTGAGGLAPYNGTCLPAPGAYIANVTANWEFPNDTLGPGLNAAGNDSADVAQIGPNSTAGWIALQKAGEASIAEIPSEGILDLGFDLNWSLTEYQDDGFPGSPNVPSDFLAGPAARGLLTTAYPYAGIENSIWTVDGVQYLVPSGGPIPRNMPPYSASIYPPTGNVTFPNGSPDRDPSDVGGAAWWWAQGTDPTSPYYDGQLAACAPDNPCTFPIVGTQDDPDLDASIAAYISSIESITGGAVQPFTFDLSFGQEISSLGAYPVGNSGWAPDYPDPADYTVAFSQPDGPFTGPDSLGQVLGEPAYNDSSLCGHSAVNGQDLGYWAEQGPLVPACQGVAYAVAEGWMAEISHLPSSPARVEDYVLVTKVLNDLDLYVWYGQQNAVFGLAPWINASSVNTNPLFGGAGDFFWFQLRYLSAGTSAAPPSTTVGVAPGTPLYDPANNEIYVPDAGSANVSVLSGSTDDLLTTIPVGSNPETPVLDPGSGEIFVANFLSGNVSVINASTDLVVGSITVGTGPRVPTYDPASDELFVPNNGSGNISVLSGVSARVVATLVVGTEPDTGAYDAANEELYVPNFGSDNVSVLNGSRNAFVASVDVGSGPSPPVYDPADGDLYVPNLGSGNVSVIYGSTNQVVATILVGSLPFVVRGGSEPIDIFSRTTAPTGAPLYDPANHEVYVADAGSAAVSVINGTSYTVTATIGVGSGPQAPVLDPGSGNIYVANSGSDNISVISADTDTVASSLPTGSDPAPPVFDNDSGEVYVPSTASDNVTAFPVMFYVSFVESGLPSGAVWRLALGAAPTSTAAVFSRTTVPFAEENGSYPYTIVGPAGYRVAPPLAPAGSITVTGTDLAVKVVFVAGRTYAASFAESGLPKGTPWCATLGWVTCSTTATIAVANLTPGRYPFAVGSIPDFARVLAPGGPRYSAPAQQLNITHHGVTVKATFTERRYALTFVESGLAPGTSWSVRVQYTFYGRTITKRLSSKHAEIVVDVPNATVAYAGGAVKGYTGGGSGAETVNGAPLSVQLTYARS